MSDTVVLDFETYYDKDYSLSKMTTEDYVTDPRFEVMLVGAKRNDETPIWYSGTHSQTKAWLQKLELERAAVIAHNSMFDMLVLQHQFGIRPGFIIDTLAMAQAALKPFIPRISLAACLEYCQLGIQKGTAVKQMIGRSRQSLSRAELNEYAAYCMDDCEGEYRLFKHMKPLFPQSEFRVMDMTHRMYLDPVLELDSPLLAEILHEERAKKQQLLADGRVDKVDLMSNEKFAELLLGLGVTPPRKVSPTTGKETWALAKTDPGFLELEQEYSDHSVVSAIIAARKGLKTTINETRAERLLQISLKYKKLRVPLSYHAAHTGRYGGTQKINMQNPPRVDKSRMRYAMKAPAGHVMLAADMAQIEARIVAWLAGEHKLLDGFRNAKDIYSEFATAAYNRDTVKGRSKDDDKRRFVGKTCILGLGYGMGAEKLKNTLFKDGVKVDFTEAQRLTSTYRELYRNTTNLWYQWGAAMGHMSLGSRIVKLGPCKAYTNCVVLPNGMPLVFHNLQQKDGQWQYSFGYEVRSLWGGKLLENVTQALARTIIMENMLAIKDQLGLSPALQVHDELDYVVLKEHAETTGRQIAEIMSAPPSWAPDLPVAVEVAYGPSFGDCK